MRQETRDANGAGAEAVRASRVSRLASEAPYSFTLKAWPVIALATIGLCYLTQTVAGWFGVTLPDQQNIEVVRRCLSQAFASSKHFGVAAFLVLQVVVLLPAAEEMVFRCLLFRLPQRLIARRKGPTEGTGASGETGDAHSIIRLFDYSIILFSSLLFSAAHYLAQPWPDAAFLALFFFGVAQCGLYQKTGRIVCAMLNHALFNLTNLVLLFVLPE